MRPFGTSGGILAIVLCLPATAAYTDPVHGEWAQVATNAGVCPTCRIFFQAAPTGLMVTANNGWSATLSQIGPTDWSGAGRWDATSRGWASGRPFTIGFHREGERLHMTMVVDTGAARKPIVRGTFGRPWQGV